LARGGKAPQTPEIDNHLNDLATKEGAATEQQSTVSPDYLQEMASTINPFTNLTEPQTIFDRNIAKREQYKRIGGQKAADSNDAGTSEKAILDALQGSSTEHTESAKELGGSLSKEEEAAFWIPQATPDGRLFYFNTLTGVSALELPAAAAYYQRTSEMPERDRTAEESEEDVPKHISAEAVRHLTSWLDENRHHPYPSAETKQLLSEACGISTKQVTTWFTNMRQRQLRSQDSDSGDRSIATSKKMKKKKKSKKAKTYEYDREGTMQGDTSDERSREEQMELEKQPSLLEPMEQSAREISPDDNSDSSHTSLGPWTRRNRYKREYNPRIRNLLAAHQAELQQLQLGGNLMDIKSDTSFSKNNPFRRRLMDDEQQIAREKITAIEGAEAQSNKTPQTSTVNNRLDGATSHADVVTLKTGPAGNPWAAFLNSRRKKSDDRVKPGAANEEQRESKVSAKEDERVETPIAPSDQSSNQMTDIQNQQRLNVQIPVDVHGEDNPESPSTNRYKCPHCAADFTRQHNLESHLLIHSEETPYECPTCQARFKRLFALKRHTKIHVSERPHTCSKCGRRFARSDTLARHNKAGCTDRHSSLGIDENIVDGKGDEGMDGAVFTNEPDKDYKDNDDGKNSRDTVHALQERSPEDAELIKERERILYEYELRNYNNKKAGRDNETDQITEEDKELEESMRKRLKQFGFEDDQINAMTDPQQQK
jgi:DNA-directed RNA polymerase subunit RPC12/RpoP